MDPSQSPLMNSCIRFHDKQVQRAIHLNHLDTPIGHFPIALKAMPDLKTFRRLLSADLKQKTYRPR